jgi:hypothetical protein
MEQKHKKVQKYTYDYPENRKLGDALNFEDRKWIANRLGKHVTYIYAIFIIGNRTNAKAIELAEIIIKQKQEREALVKDI